jgi:hypothetical protein
MQLNCQLHALASSPPGVHCVVPRVDVDCWRRTKSLALLAIEPPFVRLQACSLVTILAELSQCTVETLDKSFDVELGVGSLHCRSFPHLLWVNIKTVDPFGICVHTFCS